MALDLVGRRRGQVMTAIDSADVTVVEAGPADGRPEIDHPFGAAALFASEVDRDLASVPQQHAGGRVLHKPRGRSLGGSTILNGMLYIRGARGDHDAWAAAGATGWSWRGVEPYFRRLEGYDGPTDGAQHHGPAPGAPQRRPRPVG
jgi:choline dehydrogenase